MGKKIVGRFDGVIEKILFYEIMDDYREFTIIRQQGTDDFYIWDNKRKILSALLDIKELPDEKYKYNKIITEVRFWFVGVVFFWADSKFVKQYGLPNYEKLITLYKELVQMRMTEVEIYKSLDIIKEEENFFGYLKCKIASFRYLLSQRSIIRKLKKEYKLIW